jgi:hypothetical protein
LADVARTTTKDRSPVLIRSAGESAAVRSLQGQRSAFSAEANFSALHHNGLTDHLPPTSSNIDLVSKLEMDTPDERRSLDTANDAVVPGQIADLAIHKGYAYLNSWDEPSCQRGGTFIVDIRNPDNPQQTGFLPALPGRYHGEGAHVVTLNTPAFQGDLLAVNNEQYNQCTDENDPLGYGGFDLYDVTDPRNPEIFVQGIGDTGGEGELEGDFPTPNSSHSTFVWQGRDRRAFVVFVDNVEFTDVDIFEITDPANPRPVAEYDLVEVAANQGVDIIDQLSLGGLADVFLHDMVVKEIGGRFIMLADYWDAGYVTLDITNPGDPIYIGDSTFNGPDPLTGMDPQEGNGHQGEFSHDNQYILAADEEFSSHRPVLEITTGPNAGAFDAGPVGGGASPTILPDGRLNGPTVYGGYGCDASDPIPPRAGAGLPPLEPGEEAIIVLQRGPSADPDNPEPACFPGEKAENGINAGYDAVLLTNHHPGEAQGIFCGSGDFPASPPIVTVCTSHAGLHTIFGETPSTPVPVPPGHGPALGALGEKVEATAVFDGWGKVHLIDNEPGKMTTRDTYAVRESLNPAYSSGFGDLSVHEFAADPDTNVAYSSYYAAGMRVFTFGPGGLVEQGRFIDEGGSNFWGVEQFTTADGERLFAGSDRDYGLYIFRYTGPGAVQKPQPAPQPAPPPPTVAPESLDDPQIAPVNRRVGARRYVRIPVSCAETAGGNCRGKLTIERRNGWTTLAQRWFTKQANELSTVRLRLSRAEFRRLVNRRRQRVTVELLTRGSDGLLRQASTRITLLAPRR